MPINPFVTALFLIIGTVWIVVESWLIRRIREHHPDTYIELGRPRSVLGINRKLGEFIVRNRHRELGDPLLARLGDVAQLTVLGAGVCLVALWADLAMRP